MFFKQGCSALVQNLLAKSYSNFYWIQCYYSTILFWSLIYNLPQNITPFVYNWASVYSTRGNDAGQLFSTSSTFLSELFNVFFQNLRSIKNLKSFMEDKDIFKLELVDVCIQIYEKK